ncbi:MAG: exonuclease domain-containing protein [Candidatus Woesearchaeota archaeon]
MMQAPLKKEQIPSVYLPRYIILYDTEYTSWEGTNEQGYDTKKQQFREITQIGAIKVDLITRKIVDEFCMFVKPLKNPTLSEYNKNLTKITQEQIDSAQLFVPVWQEFLQFIKQTPCFSFGNDASVLTENVLLHELSTHFDTRTFHNLQTLFLTLNMKTKGFASSTLPTLFGIKNPYPEHNALGDAKSLWLVIQELPYVVIEDDSEN